MMRARGRWRLILLAAVLLVAACAPTPPPYLCVQARMGTGAPALYCQPIPRDADAQ